MYIADGYVNHRVRKVTISTGIITTIAGTGTAGYSGDNGPATAATLNYPTGLKVDAAGTFLLIFIHLVLLIRNPHLGNVYINDLYNNRVRKVMVSTGSITTIAGSGSTGSTSGSYSGDNGQATAATLNFPVGVTLDASGTAVSCIISSIYLTQSLPRQRVHRRYWQPPYPQGNGLHRDYHHLRRHRIY